MTSSLGGAWWRVTETSIATRSSFQSNAVMIQVSKYVLSAKTLTTARGRLPSVIWAGEHAFNACTTRTAAEQPPSATSRKEFALAKLLKVTHSLAPQGRGSGRGGFHPLLLDG